MQSADCPQDPAPTVHSLIDPHALERLAGEAFGLHASAPLFLIQTGLNDHYALSTSHGDFVMRVYRRGWRTRDDVVWELELVNHLAQCGAPVAAPLPCADGRWYTELAAAEGTRYVAIFQRARGSYTHFGATGRHRISPASCAEAFGRSMAEIHAAADSYRPSASRFQLDFSHLLEQPLAAIGPIFTEYPQEVEDLVERAGLLRVQLERRLANADWGACHGDISGGNSTYCQGQVIHFDFDCAGFGWRMYDLGVFYWSLTLNGHGDDVWEPFLRGYRSLRSISEEDIVLVRGFAAVRVIWLMGLWCANAQRFGRHILHADYFDRERGRFVRLYEQAMELMVA